MKMFMVLMLIVISNITFAQDVNQEYLHNNVNEYGNSDGRIIEDITFKLGLIRSYNYTTGSSASKYYEYNGSLSMKYTCEKYRYNGVVYNLHEVDRVTRPNHGKIVYNNFGLDVLVFFTYNSIGIKTYEGGLGGVKLESLQSSRFFKDENHEIKISDVIVNNHLEDKKIENNIKNYLDIKQGNVVGFDAELKRKEKEAWDKKMDQIEKTAELESKKMMKNMKKEQAAYNQKVTDYRNLGMNQQQAVHFADQDKAYEQIQKGLEQVSEELFKYNKQAYFDRQQRIIENREYRRKKKLEKQKNKKETLTAKTFETSNASGLLVKRNKKGWYGYVNKSGKWIIKPKYLEAKPFKNGQAKVVTKFNKEITINKYGKKIS